MQSWRPQQPHAAVDIPDRRRGFGDVRAARDTTRPWLRVTRRHQMTRRPRGPVVSEVGAPSTPSTPGETWNSPQRIAIHRGLSPSERLQLTIEASRAALRFAEGERVDERRAGVRA